MGAILGILIASITSCLLIFTLAKKSIGGGNEINGRLTESFLKFNLKALIFMITFTTFWNLDVILARHYLPLELDYGKKLGKAG